MDENQAQPSDSFSPRLARNIQHHKLKRNSELQPRHVNSASTDCKKQDHQFPLSSNRAS